MNITDITANEAAQRLGITRQAVSKQAQAGKIPGAWKDSYSTVWHIPEESVEAMRRERETIKED